MHQQDKELDRLTAELIRNAGTDEPSAGFTANLMQSVYGMQIPARKSFNLNYLWFLLIIPVLAGSGWYLSSFPEFKSGLNIALQSTLIFLNSVFTYSSEILRSLRILTSSTVLMISLLAAVVLLLIDFLISVKRYSY